MDDNNEFTPTDSSYVSSALGNAYASGLTLSDVFNASGAVYFEEEESLDNGEAFFDAPRAFDVAICATINLKQIVQEYYKNGPKT